MTPEEKARLAIDEKLNQSGWVIQDMKRLNLSASLGVAVREFPTSTGEVDYALFVDGTPVGVVEAKREDPGGVRRQPRPEECPLLVAHQSEPPDHAGGAGRISPRL